MTRPGKALKIRVSRKVNLDHDKALENIAKRRKDRESIDEMRIVRAAEGWRIEHNKSGHRRWSPEIWPTRAEVETAMADGYQMPAFERRADEAKHIPAFRKANIHKLKKQITFYECYWCKREGHTVQAVFSLTFRSRQDERWVTQRVCDPDNHNINKCSWFNSELEAIRSFIYEENDI
jgi:hypothetical protein